jgi:hypothetical protein
MLPAVAVRWFVPRDTGIIHADDEAAPGKQIAATMAEVGMEPIEHHKRKCAKCGGDIPRYSGTGKARKATRKDARFCSTRCAQRASRLSKSTNAGLTSIGAQKCPSSGPCQPPPAIPSVTPEGA